MSADAPQISKDGARLVYCFDNTLEGFFSAVFMAYANHADPMGYYLRTEYRPGLFDEMHVISTDVSLALRVQQGLVRALGQSGFNHIKCAFLSSEEEARTITAHYIRLIMANGRHAGDDLTLGSVAAFEKTWQSVSKEAHYMLQFLRFSSMEGNVFFARINPKHNVVPLIMGHFCNRFNDQAFIIYDEVHKIAGVYDTHRWQLVVTDKLTVPELAEEEQEYRRMWKTFYDRIANPRRYNPVLRRSFMPMRFWKNITEMDPTLVSSDKDEMAALIQNGRPAFGAPADDRSS